VTTAPSGTLADYVSGTSDAVLAVRVRSTRSDGSGFYTSADLLRITFDR
jgi:hypothetical protein